MAKLDAKNDRWIKAWESLLGSPIFQSGGLFRLWTYCMFQANWRDRKTLIPGTLKEVVVKRGQFITGRFAIHDALYGKGRWKPDVKGDKPPSPSTVWRWIDALKEMGCVTVENLNNQCSLITVCNYGTYQSDTTAKLTASEQHLNSDRTTTEQPLNSDWTASEQHLNTLEESNNSKKDRKVEGKEETTTPRSRLAESVSAVVEHYQRYHPKARPGKAERSKIEARLKEGTTVEEAKRAIDGCHRSPYHSGENDRQQKYQTIDLIFRSADKVAVFIELAEQHERPAAFFSPETSRMARAGQEWAARKMAGGDA